MQNEKSRTKREVSPKRRYGVGVDGRQPITHVTMG